MNKRQRNFQKILEYKQRFEKLSSESIRYRLALGSLIKEAETAYREILKDHGEPLYIIEGRKPESDEQSGAL